jgi:hypothetical protein
MHLNWSDATTVAVLINSAVCAAAFWFAAVRLRGPWFLYGLAATTTLKTLLVGGMLSILVFEKPWLDFDPLFHIEAIEQFVEAAFYIPLAIWLVRRFNSAREV